MPPGGLWSRIREARLFRVVVVYLAASWVVIQVVNELTESLALPAWVSPVAVILLLIGLVIILATAWVQSHPLVSQRADAEEVPHSWELDLGDAAKALAKGRLPHLTWARTLVGGAAAFLLLFGIAGLYVVVKDRGRSFLPDPVVAESAPDGIAVLPFSVRGAGIAEWREGLVDLLSTGLDGAGGLRTISSGTVLGRWHESVPDTSVHPDAATALRIARQTGARYALLGSAVAIGPRVRISAEVHDLDTGDRLGQVQAEAPPDSVLSLVDRIAVQALALIGGRGGGDLPHVDIAAVTTTSLPALKAYLEGEALFRRSDFKAATTAFERAVREDSLFALAFYRLSQAFGWGENINSARGADALERAVALLGRLPEREALLVRAAHALHEPDVEALALAQDATQRYPDDAEAWYQLGEAQLHIRETLMGWDEAEQSFQRAVRLAPRFAPYRIHLVEAAARYHADSAMVAERLDQLERLAPDSWTARRYRIVESLAWGDSTRRAAALAAFDSLPFGPDMAQIALGLANPLHWETQQELMRRGRARAPAPVQADMTSGIAWQTLLKRGRFDAAIAELSQPGARAFQRLELEAVAAIEFGVPVPTPALDSALAAARAGRFGDEGLWAVATYAAQQGAWDAHAAAIARLRAAADSVEASGDSTDAAGQRAEARGLEAFGIWKRGRAAEAARILEEIRVTASDEGVRWRLGQIHREQGNLREAERYFRTFLTWDPDPMASYELGRIYQTLGELEAARQKLEFFVANWADADPVFQPLVEDAKRRLTELRAG